MYCPHCGVLLPEGGKFCSACGRPLPRPVEVRAPAPVAVPVRGPGGKLPSCVRAALALEEGETIVSAWQAYAPGLLRAVMREENAIRPASENGYLLASDRRLHFLAPVNGAGTSFHTFRRLRYEDLTAVEAAGLGRGALVLRTEAGGERYTGLRDLDLTLRRGGDVDARDAQAVLLELVRGRVEELERSGRAVAKALPAVVRCPNCGASARGPRRPCRRCGTRLP